METLLVILLALFIGINVGLLLVWKDKQNSFQEGFIAGQESIKIVVNPNPNPTLYPETEHKATDVLDTIPDEFKQSYLDIMGRIDNND